VLHREPGLARVALAARPELCNSFGVAHGGAVATLADVALALAVIARDPAAVGALTIQLQLTFVGPGAGRLVAEGRSLEVRRAVAFAEGEVRDAEGALVAKAVATFQLRRAERAPPRPRPRAKGRG